MSNNLLETLGWKNEPEKQTLNSSNSKIAAEKYLVGLCFCGWYMYNYFCYFLCMAIFLFSHSCKESLLHNLHVFELELNKHRREEKKNDEQKRHSEKLIK